MKVTKIWSIQGKLKYGRDTFVYSPILDDTQICSITGWLRFAKPSGPDEQQGFEKLISRWALLAIHPN